MKKQLFILLCSVLTVPALAQVSWMSRPSPPSQPYVAPVDVNLLQQSMIYKQSQYDRNNQFVKNSVGQTIDLISLLKEVHPKAGKFWLNMTYKAILRLNNENLDFANINIAESVIAHFTDIQDYVKQSLKLPTDNIPSVIELTTF